MARIVISQGPGKGATYEITGPLSIGRSASNAIRLLDKSISRNHAQLEPQGNTFIIKDLNSKNGVLVNGTKAKQHKLARGDRVNLGRVELIYEPDFEIRAVPGQKGNLFILPEEKLPEAFITTPLTEIDITKTIPIKSESISKHEAQFIENLGQRLKYLYEITRITHSAKDEMGFLTKTLEILLKLFGMERGAVILCNESGENLQPAVIKTHKGSPDNITLSSTILKAVLRNKQVIFSSDIGFDNKLKLSQSLRLDQIKSVLGIPLLNRHNTLLGLLYFDTRAYWQKWEDEDLRFLTVASQLLALGLENFRSARELKEEIKLTSQKAEHELNIIGEDLQIMRLLKTIRTIAPREITVLIRGETGTGKELIARAIHFYGPRRTKPFVTVDCAALPGGLLESELFGYEKGAFTGANRTKTGRFEWAQSGTIFLDEIGNMELATQAKLLRVVETKEFTRVGGLKLISADIRIIAATNQNLEELVRNGQFRDDLFYRLGATQVFIPPLKERRGDIPLVIKYFVNKFAQESGKPISGLSPQAIELLVNYHWPGNVRELRNVIERAVALCDTPVIVPQDLPGYLLSATSKPEPLRPIVKGSSLSHIVEQIVAEETPLNDLIAEIEKQSILKALASASGNKSRAAQWLKISRPTLDKKLAEYGKS